MMVVVTDHFSQRVQERLPGVDPVAFAKGAVWAIKNNYEGVTYAGRSYSGGQIVRGFDFEVADKTFRFFVSDREPHKAVFITVFPVEDAA